ncbi:MAG: D-amino-acid transaminase [Rhodospirillaceae bacterium]|nr:D-amino-acid transaminase [Rhodospirillaceae bacterium]MDD9917380.1 D-amino-acid transaminase [Rhodospirillaceae bacterium]MDD9926254.1 D-amino-acid transaminase [Rhodospirillaceae bacterium]
MARYAYVNGRYVPHGDAAVHIEDRGFQFADGVYEVVPIVSSRLVDAGPHLDRLERSLSELTIAMPLSRKVLELVMDELIARNGVNEGLIYMQVTRGVSPRDHKFPSGVRPSIVMTTKRVRFLTQKKLSDGVKVITIPDIRWTRCDIKTVALLPNCMGKTEAAAVGAYEAWQVDGDGMVTEGTSSNAWIVTHDDKLVTRPAGHEILRGVTRQTLLRIAAEAGLTFEERPFSVEEAKSARETFLSSATSFVTPVVELDEVTIGDGTPGPLSRRLQGWYLDYCAGLKNSA